MWLCPPHPRGCPRPRGVPEATEPLHAGQRSGHPPGSWLPCGARGCSPATPLRPWEPWPLWPRVVPAATAPPPSLPPARLLWAPLGCADNSVPLGGGPHLPHFRSQVGSGPVGQETPPAGESEELQALASSVPLAPRGGAPPEERAQDLVGKRSRGPPRWSQRQSGPPATSGGVQAAAEKEAGALGLPVGVHLLRRVQAAWQGQCWPQRPPRGTQLSQKQAQRVRAQAQRRSRSGRERQRLVSRGPGWAGLDRGRRICPLGGDSWRRGPRRSSTPGSWAEPSTGRRTEEWAWPRHQLTR